MEQLLDETQLRETSDRDRVALDRSVVGHDLGRRVEHDAVLLVAVERVEHVRDGGDPLVGHALLEDVEAAGVGEPEGSVAQRVGGDPEVDRGVGQFERRTGEPDPGAGRHAGDVGDGEDLGRCAVQARRACRPDPHTDRQWGVGDQLQQLGHHVVADDGTTRVDLQHERLRALFVGPFDRVADLTDDDVVEEPADLQHVDRAHSCVVVLRRCPAGRNQRQQGGAGEEADQ